MAKLRDTAIKDNLSIAGNVTAAGKVLSVEGHTHTPANITGLDKYIEDKVKASGTTLPENINAKTLDGHAASDFVLKSEVGNTTSDKDTDKIIADKEYLFGLGYKLYFKNTNDILIRIEDLNSIITIFNGTIVDAVFKNSIEDIAYKIPRIEFVSNYEFTIYNLAPISSNILIRLIGVRKNINDIKIDVAPYGEGRGGKYNIAYNKNINNIKLYNDVFYSIDGYRSIVSKPKFSFKNTNKYLYVRAVENLAIFDLDNNKYVRFYGNIWWGNDSSGISIKTNNQYFNEFVLDLTNWSNNIAIISQEAFYAPTRSMYTFNQSVSITQEDKIEYFHGTGIYDKLRSLFNISTNSEINCNINGIHFDGKTDITIPAPTNALTLGGLDSSQFIKATDVGNAAGKIPRFDNDGFLVYPDGSKERIENG